MPYCPNCGAFVPSGNSTCSCGTSFILSYVHQKYIIVSLMIFAYWKEIGILDMEVIPMKKYLESKQMQ